MSKQRIGKASGCNGRWLSLALPTVLVLLWASSTAQAWTIPFPSLPNKRPLINVRGYDKNRYGLQNNSTIPNPMEVAKIVGVQPCWMAPKLVWAYAWRLHGLVLPLLHFRDEAKPRDSKYSLKVLWCKAIASLDRSSKVYDDRWTYDTLPSPSRWMLRVLPSWLFPRLHHANIEVRTAYLNSIIQGEIERLPLNTTIRLISLGAGYDVRCSRLLSQYSTERSIEAYELDLDHVVESKRQILSRLGRRRGPNTRHPALISMDLNEVDGTVKDTLENIFLSNPSAHTIFVSEGVMIYLQKGVPGRLLHLMADTAQGNTASICFADRLENVPAGDLEAAKMELGRAGWELMDFCPKPGLARHMGLARLAAQE